MKNKKIITALLTISLLSIGIWSGYSPAKADSQNFNLLSVNGEAKGTQSPDTAVITFGVSTLDKDMTKATNMNNQKASAIIAKIKPLLCTSRGDSIKTSTYTLRQEYEYNNNQKLFKGYRINNRVIVKTKDVNSISKLIGTAIASGANEVQGLDFSLENTNPYCKDLLVKATQNARNEAETVAGALGVKVIGINKVSSSCSSSYRNNSPVMFKALGSMDESSSHTPIEAGDIDLNANVNIDFVIGN